MQTRRTFLKLSAGGALSTVWALEGCSRFSTPTVDAPSTTADGPSTATTAVDGETEHTPPRLRIAFANVPTQLDPAIMSANAAI
ncbi:MAG: hypothetical protein KDE53_28615, partial [Caldilineaceae bacterium]|nr:hypothetical protein [Caldilineaceae bacterium]